ncbi:MAG: methylated-DNA--[protein]-cysteine S-methyltransferase [Gammaproteobacteria bacterium]|nr:methylated-DNA--[protein]-cysteine S-methyltransferase [Gammaproteobacteria bacterium]
MKYTIIDTQLGPLLIAGDAQGLRHVSFQSSNSPLRPQPDWIEDPGICMDAQKQLRAYFAGELKEFDLKLAPQGTAFQKRVWRELEKIPYGEMISYGELAKRIGNAKASRAVGAANGRNPLPVVVPCHRVIGGDGSLTGYAGGVRFKRALLELEGGVSDQKQQNLI